MLGRALRRGGYLTLEVDSEIDWKAIRGFARAAAKRLGVRVSTHLGARTGRGDWPRLLQIWNPDREASDPNARRTARAAAIDAFLREDAPD